MPYSAPTLVIVETTSYARAAWANKHGLSPIGHYLEGIEAFSTSWPGHVVLMSPAQTPRTLSGVDEYIDMPIDAQPSLFLTYRKSIKRQAILHYMSKVGLNSIVRLLLRIEYESFGASSIGALVLKTLERFPNSVVLMPTATERVVEGIIRNLAHAARPRGAAPTFIPIWHFNDRWNPLLSTSFSEQLARWTERAKPWSFNHTAALEENAVELSTPTINVQWLPWPIPDKIPVAPATEPPRIYIYSVRKEHGIRHVAELCDSLLEFSGSIQLRLWISRMCQRTLWKTASHPRVEILLHGGEISRYKSSFEGVTLAILPYDAESYMKRGSAVLLSLMENRVPVIAPRGTGIGEFVEREKVGLTFTSHGEIAQLVRQVIATHAMHVEAINSYLVKHNRAASDLYSSLNKPPEGAG